LVSNAVNFGGAPSNFTVPVISPAETKVAATLNMQTPAVKIIDFKTLLLVPAQAA
jgi:hypothetical protein